MPDPKKDKAKKKSAIPHRGQQLSDKLASQVAKKRLTYEQASEMQKSQDSAYMSKSHKVGTKTRGSSQNLPSKRKYKDASYKIDKSGNMKAY
jgi:hypothetical protein